ncbi:MAG: TonB-dependent receptor [Alphaproteobacteria bacterium]|nr:TonB-dependent receptor [Alphaproteobacteria bacterium]
MKRAVFAAALLFSPLCALPAYAADASVDGMLRGADGQPLAQTQIKLQDGRGRIAQSAITDARGHYAFTHVPVGSYVLLAMQKDAVLGSSHVSVYAGQPAHRDIDLARKQEMNVVIGQPAPTFQNSLSPTTGTNSYKMDAKAIAALPQGDDTPLDKILLQTPGVAEDSAASGSLHIRGEHANVQYRLNGILLPDGIDGFGEMIDPHIIESATLLDGALPAQYGFHTAGIVDIDTKTGFENGGTAEIMGGSNGTLQPSISYGGTTGDADYFLAASHLSSDLGIENPTSGHNAIHDHTEQDKQFGYASYMINSMQRLELIAGNSISYFQIPNNPNQPAAYTIAGANGMNSASVNDRQFESNQFATAAWQGQNDGVTMQIAPYIRNSETHYRPDVAGDLTFNGVASDVQYTDLATGLQNDNSWRVNRDHTLRAGFTVQNDHIQDNSNSIALLTGAGGAVLTDGSGNAIESAPIVNNHSKDGQLYGLYLQDEWKINDKLTVNYGARFDDMEQYVSANQLSPRVGLVYKATDTTTFHAGYARYFTPPPMELVSNGDIAGFANTTNAPAITQNDAVKPERSHNFDVGVTQKLGAHWEIGNDAYYKLVHDLLDEGQFGPALILTPFNYQHGYIYGDEITANYTGDRLKAYANFAFSRAMGENVVSSQFNFTDPAELAYIGDHYVHLDHDQTYTASAGATYDITGDDQAGIDGHFGSGLRDGFANTSHLPPYATFDLSAEHKMHFFEHDETAVRLSVINVMDSAYELRSGTGIGVGAPQWGSRRGFFIAVSQKF